MDCHPWLQVQGSTKRKEIICTATTVASRTAGSAADLVRGAAPVPESTRTRRGDLNYPLGARLNDLTTDSETVSAQMLQHRRLKLGRAARRRALEAERDGYVSVTRCVCGCGLKATLTGRKESVCHYCGCQFVPSRMRTIDHIVPKALGGTNHRYNLVAACSRCNSNKGDKWPTHLDCEVCKIAVDRYRKEDAVKVMTVTVQTQVMAHAVAVAKKEAREQHGEDCSILVKKVSHQGDKHTITLFIKDARSDHNF